MALTAGGFSSYSAIGNREDLTDMIYNISPTDTPFMSSVGRTKAKAVFHEWQTDSLAAVDTGNAQLEGDDVTPAASTPTVRIGNYCQISRKSVAITGTQEVVDKAGRKSEIAYQIAKRGKELKRDMEAILTQNQGQNAGNTTTARTTRSLESWLSTNDNRGATGADAASATVGATDGTQRAFTETILKDVIQKAYTSGGEPSILMVGPVNKQAVSGFTGRTQARQTIDKERIQGAASLYASDFGELKVVPNRFQRDRTAFVLDPEHANVAYLRGFRTEELAKVGDSERRFILAEYALEMCNEAAHGVAADLTTS